MAHVATVKARMTSITTAGPDTLEQPCTPMKFDTRYTPESDARKDNEKLDEGPLLAVSGPLFRAIFRVLNVRFREKQTFAMHRQFLHK